MKPSAPREAPIFLVGFMGSGKSTVGALLAGRLNRSFIDLDAWIERKENRKISEIFDAEGEEAFRELEGRALETVSRQPWTVVATGGGAVCRPENLRCMLSSGVVIALEVSAAEVIRRTGTNSGRPLIDQSSDPLATVHDLLSRRSAQYRKAHYRIPTDEGSPQSVVADILERLGPQAMKSA